MCESINNSDEAVVKPLLKDFERITLVRLYDQFIDNDDKVKGLRSVWNKTMPAHHANVTMRILSERPDIHVTMLEKYATNLINSCKKGTLHYN